MDKKVLLLLGLFYLSCIYGFTQNQIQKAYKITKLEVLSEDITSRTDELCSSVQTADTFVLFIFKKNFNDPQTDWLYLIGLARYNSTRNIYEKVNINGTVEEGLIANLTMIGNNIHLELLKPGFSPILVLEATFTSNF